MPEAGARQQLGDGTQLVARRGGYVGTRLPDLADANVGILSEKKLKPRSLYEGL